MLETLLTCLFSPHAHDTHTHTHTQATHSKKTLQKKIQISLETHPRGVASSFTGFDWLSLNLREFDWLMTTSWLTFNSRLFLLRVCACNKKGSAKMKTRKRSRALVLVDCLFVFACFLCLFDWLSVCLFIFFLFTCLFACLFECLFCLFLFFFCWFVR